MSGLKTIKKDVFYCEYCNKHTLHKGHTLRHEQLCFKNPENKRPCFNCHNLIKKTTDYTYDWYGVENTIEVNLLFCVKKEVFLYTPQNQFKKNAYDLDECNDPMPLECEFNIVINGENAIGIYDL